MIIIRVLLLGGTGAIGKHLSKILSEDDHEVTVTSRKEHTQTGTIRYVKGNAKDLQFLKDILRGNWDVIVDFMIYSTKEFEERLGLLLGSTLRYIFLSSARVYDNSDKTITEKTPRLLDMSADNDFLSTDEYSLAKAKQENLLFGSDKTNWTIVRPYITYSEERLQLGNLEKEDWLYRALKGRTIVFSKDILKRKTTLTYGLDVARGIYNLINNEKVFGEVFNIINPICCTWEIVLETYLRVLENHLGFRPKVAYQYLDEYLKWNSKYQVIYDRLFDRCFDASKISKFVDVRSFVAPKEGLRKCLETFLKAPRFRGINWRNEALKDKYANEKTPFSEIKGVKQRLKYLYYRYIKC